MFIWMFTFDDNNKIKTILKNCLAKRDNIFNEITDMFEKEGEKEGEKVLKPPPSQYDLIITIHRIFKEGQDKKTYDHFKDLFLDEKLFLNISDISNTLNQDKDKKEKFVEDFEDKFSVVFDNYLEAFNLNIEKQIKELENTQYNTINYDKGNRIIYFEEVDGQTHFYESLDRWDKRIKNIIDLKNDVKKIYNDSDDDKKDKIKETQDNYIIIYMSDNNIWMKPWITKDNKKIRNTNTENDLNELEKKFTELKNKIEKM